MATGSGKMHLRVGGMHCSLCVETIRRAVLKLPGVRSVHVSIAHEEALVEYDPARVEPPAITATLEALGFAVRAPDEAARLAEEEKNGS
ncbi:MAG: heavy-metal-associated domain-containing protein [Armatimonadetes bacterium]|nr:heavy-metal-associated domain-containing protein [Armatimonadota bacterium]MDW8154889.1 heavy metal-associated domain-containing protein [Armatimonadota bacterium]